MQEQVMDLDPNSSTAKFVDLLGSLNRKFLQLETLQTIYSMPHIPDGILEILPETLQTCLDEIASLDRTIENWIPEENSMEGNHLFAQTREALVDEGSELLKWAKSADGQLSEKIQQMKQRQQDEEMSKESSTLRHLKQDYLRKKGSANYEIFQSSDNEQNSRNFQQASQASNSIPFNMRAPVKNNNQSDSVNN